MNPIDEMHELIDKLNYYIKMYDEGTPVITDKEYDDLYFKLEQLEEKTGIYLADSPTVHVDYFSINELKKVKHSHPMLSLDKTKSIQEVLDFIGDKDIIAMLKMDGLTCSLRYEDGLLVSAETRGNGEIGEDILHNIVTVKNVPLQIPFKSTLIIDGEVICTYRDFESFSNQFANPRNFAAGSIRLLSNGECANRHLTFIAWDVIEGFEDCKTLTEKLYKLDNLGFTFVPHLSWPATLPRTEEKFNHISMLLTDWAKKEEYPYDGLVFKYNDCEYYQSLGATGHHFKGGLAFKFYDEEYETTLLDIEWSMGKTGQLTPVAVFEPVDDGESIITRASLHNLSIMQQLLGLFPHRYQKIWVAKMNQIIPQVMRSEHSSVYEEYCLNPPKICPICGEPTIVKDDFLYCSNSNCEGKFINKLDHFVGKKGLDIKGLSKATLQKLIDLGWVGNIVELFSLSNFRDEWIKQSGFGVKSVDNILNAIENSKECELWQFISALSIPLIGSTYAKEIARREYDWHNFREDTSLNHMGITYDFTNWDGFGPNMNDSLHKFDYNEADELAMNILHIKNSLWFNPEEKKKQKNIGLNGKILCVTGKLNQFKNRDELIAAVEAAGGKVTNAVSSKTDYLVNNDVTSNSSKNVKAKQLNIPIISEAQLLELL